MNYHNPYARIQEYFALLSASMNFTDSSDNGKSMQQICESKQIPVKIVRNDFLTIFQWQRSMNLVKNSDKNELAVLFYDNRGCAYGVQLLFPENARKRNRSA